VPSPFEQDRPFGEHELDVVRRLVERVAHAPKRVGETTFGRSSRGVGNDSDRRRNAAACR
jgi:hypothetical protein